MKELGQVLEVYTSPDKGIPMQRRGSVRAIRDVGLEGDRYAAGKGAYSNVRIPNQDRQVSIISSKGIDQANAILTTRGLAPFTPEETRRNIVVDAEPEALESLLGKTFTIGGVEMEGSDLCTPCRRPASLLKRSDGKDFEDAFANRGGLRARILSDGEIKPGGALYSTQTAT